MTPDEDGPSSETPERGRRPRRAPGTSWAKPVGASVVCVLLLGLAFFGLHALMGARPEFIGRGLVFEREGLDQLAPTFVVRRTADDTAVFARRHPDHSGVLFDMDAQSDARGLSTLESMRGVFRGEYMLENAEAQPVFVLFRCPYPRSGGPRGERARCSGMKLTTETPGTRVDASDAWLWSGELAAGASLRLELTYEIPRVVSIAYQVDPAVRETVRALDLAIEMDELPPMVVFSSRDGERVPTDLESRWNPTSFLPGERFGARILEGQSLFAALRRLLEIGPLVALLFFAAAVPLAATRARLSTLHVFRLAAAWGLYFPLVLYLSVMLPFVWALGIATLVPGLLLVNHARFLLGRRLGIACAALGIVVYQLFPTLTAFASWNRGLVLLCIGTVTLFVLAHLSNRSLRLQPAAALSACLLLPSRAPMLGGLGGFGGGDAAPAGEATPLARGPLPIVSLGIAEYRMRLEDRFVDVEAEIPIQVLRSGEGPVRLFSDALYLREAILPTFLRLVGTGPGLEVLVPGEGAGVVRLRYRVPVAVSGERLSTSVPLARAPASRVFFESAREGLEFQGASLWASSTADGRTIHELGSAGGERLEIASLARAEHAAPAAAGPTPELEPTERSDLYGIGIVAAHHLTVVGSDGAALHFAVYSLPATAGDAFELELPDRAGADGILSATVDGLEVERPAVVDGAVRIPLDVGPERGGPHEVALRIDLGRLPLGFLGTLELELPRPAATTGEVRWAIALPADFAVRVQTSGLDPEAGASDLASFGDYGRALRALEPVHLSKSLAPARRIACNLRYHQRIPGVTEPTERAAR